MAERQRATAVYLIDRFALRVGNEKGDDEADTFGCCSLRHDHITLKEPNLVTFDFLGKDSIRFYQPDKEVDLQIFKNLKIFKKQSSEGDDLFDRVNVSCPLVRLTEPILTGLLCFSAYHHQQVPRKLHGRPICQSVPYL